MGDDQFHYPPGAEPEQPQDQEVPEVETTPEADPTPTPEPETPAEVTPEPENDPEPEPQTKITNKPRTLLEAKQAEKEKRKEAETVARTEKVRAEAAEARVAELEALIHSSANAQTPADQSTADADLKKFAEEQGLDAEGLKKITDFLATRIGGQKVPDEIQKKLGDLEQWKAQHEQSQQRLAEDREIDGQADVVKEQLKELGHEIHKSAEATAVMNEIKRLAHTKDFHDKPLDYIVYANRKALSQMISPKKQSFEVQTPNAAEPSGSEINFAKGGITPGQAQSAMYDQPARSGFEVR